MEASKNLGGDQERETEQAAERRRRVREIAEDVARKSAELNRRLS